MSIASPKMSSSQSSVQDSLTEPGCQKLIESRKSTVVLEKLKKLLKKKTRFKLSEFSDATEESYVQDFTLLVKHTLYPNRVSANINGHFKPSSGDRQCESPSKAIEHQKNERLELAYGKFFEKLNSDNIKFNSIKSGVFLPANGKKWKLDACGVCEGNKHVECSSCKGSAKLICSSCSGAGRSACGACNQNGSALCNSCGGAGRKQQQVWGYNGPNGWENAARWEYRTCNVCHGAGWSSCIPCGGSGWRNCWRCRSSGWVRCSTCSGSGKIKCSSCEASGLKGIAEWLDINVSTEYEVLLPDGNTDLPRQLFAQILQKEGAYQVAELATTINHLESKSVDTHGSVSPVHFTQLYRGELKVTHLKVRYNSKDYAITAYGEDNNWLTVDNIFDDILENDLTEFSNAVKKSKSYSKVRKSLRNVTASEANVDALSSYLSDEKLGRDYVPMSGRYVHGLYVNFSETIRRATKKFTNRFIFVALFATLFIAYKTWTYNYSQGLVIAVSVFSIFLFSTFIYRWRLYRALYRYCGKKTKLKPIIKREISLIKTTTKRIWVPSLILASAFIYYLPTIFPSPMQQLSIKMAAARHAQLVNHIHKSRKSKVQTEKTQPVQATENDMTRWFTTGENAVMSGISLVENELAKWLPLAEIENEAKIRTSLAESELNKWTLVAKDELTKIKVHLVDQAASFNMKFDQEIGSQQNLRMFNKEGSQITLQKSTKDHVR